MSKLIEAACYVKEEIEYRKMCSQAFRKCTYGDKNRHRKFRILSSQSIASRAQGLMSMVLDIILPEMIDAREQGYIPVVDLYKSNRNYPLIQDKEFWKRENAWEYYFTQPEKGISLEEVWKSRYVERQVTRYKSRYGVGDSLLQWDAKLKYISAALHQNIHLQKNIAERVRNEKQKLFPLTDKVLGVGIRAGYRRGIILNQSLYGGHPLVGSCTDYIKDIEKTLSKWRYDSFFLTVDDSEYLKEIKNYFGNNCICLERARKHYFKDAISDIPYLDNEYKTNESVSVRSINEDYLVDLYLLAQCDSLYASRGTGNNFAYLVNGGKFTHVKFNDLGQFQK